MSAARGGCHCGTVRFVAWGEPVYVGYCHCEDCRRWSGAPVSAFVGYGEGCLEFEQGVPGVYASSPGVRRSFCVACGTSLFYEDERLPGEVYVCVGVFDEPGRFEPLVHGYHSSRLPWFDVQDRLPRLDDTARPR